VAVGDRLEGRLEIGEGLDGVDLRRFDQGGDAAPCAAALIMAREERVLAVQGYGTDQVLDAAGVDLDAPVVEEGLEGTSINSLLPDLWELKTLISFISDDHGQN